MAILKNVKIYYLKANPKRPNARLNKNNPTWEVQCRTDDPAQRDEWVKLGLRPRLMVYKEGSENEGEPILNDAGKKQWRLNLTKRSMNSKTKEPADPPSVVNGHLEPIDPDTVGNGSVANIRVFMREYKAADGSEKLAAALMAIQVKKLIVYEPKDREEFEMEETEIVGNGDDDDFDKEDDEDGSSKSPKAPSPTVKTADERPEDAF